MCLSRLHRVVARPSGSALLVEDVEGRRTPVSLLAFSSDRLPEPGEWVTVHSGFALQPVDAVEAEAVARELRRVLGQWGAGGIRGDEQW